MRPTSRQLSDFNNRVSFYNDNVEQLWINKVYNKLPKLFEAVILSGMPEQSNSPNTGAVTEADIQEVNDNRYYFVRVRPIQTIDFIIPNPFYATNLSSAKRLINMHPMAYIEVNKSVHPPTHGDIYHCRFSDKSKLSMVLVKRLRNSGFKIGKVANRNLHKAYNNTSPMMMPQGGGKDQGDYKNKYGLKPDKGIYNGRFLPKGTEVLNGYPNYGDVLLQQPDTRFWKLSGSGSGALLKDYIDDFNRLCEHFFNDRGKKFKSNGMRSFETQLRLRKASVAKGNCGSVTKSGCSTARPGTSNHGWGQAVDRKKPNGQLDRSWSSKDYIWMVNNAGTYNWHHPSWAQIDGSEPEAWHWEPMNKVITVL